MPYRTPKNPVLKFLVITSLWALLGIAGLIVLLWILIMIGAINPMRGFVW